MFAASKTASGASPYTPTYIEEVFSTWLYTGNDSTQTITNGIDLSGKGGMVWIKNRASGFNNLTDTARGVSAQISSNSTSASGNYSAFQSFNTNGFTVYSGDLYVNASGNNYVSWTFRKQPKFFDVVTYTGNGTSQTINHNLGSTPGFIICKSTTSARNWLVYHRSIGATQFLQLDTTIAATTATTPWNNTAPTSTTFTVGSSLAGNESGQTFVAYLFAHNAGGFGLTGTDNVISCGSYTGNGSTTGPVVTLGYEPQWVLIKRTDAAGDDWMLEDTMRSMSVTGSRYLSPNSSAAEGNVGGPSVVPTATGFRIAVDSTFTSFNASGGTYIYIAIRRGPMKPPTSGTSVYAPAIQTSSGNTYDLTFSSLTYTDALISWKDLTNVGGTYQYNHPAWNDRLRGFPIDMTGATQANNPALTSSTTSAESTGSAPDASNYLAGVTMNRAVWGGGWNGYSGVFHALKRAPSFFDVVCYNGNSTQTAYNHNLGVAPQLVIVKVRNTAGEDWPVWSIYGTQRNAYACILDGTSAYASRGQNMWGDDPDPPAAPSMTATTFRVGNNTNVNETGKTYVAYLFATCAGVSKVGSYSGTGSTQTIDCGFTGGARFVMIKRIDSTGDWYVWNTAQGMTSGNDKYVRMNSNQGPVTSNLVYTATTGFQIVTGTADINASGGTYIYLAIA